MRQGTYFPIPEGPGDVESLWRHGRPIDGAELPTWLAPEYASQYRRVAAPWRRAAGPDEQARYAAEVRELKAAGLIVEPDPEECAVHRVYVSVPTDDLWSIGIYVGRSPLELAAPPEVTNPVLGRHDVSDVPASAVADPFLVNTPDGWHMFFEVMNWRTQKGEIALATSGDGMRWAYRGRVLTEPFHLSYPYVFESSGAYYMVPESAGTGAARLYVSTDFPLRWRIADILLEGQRFADTSIFQHGDRWWLFTETSPGRHDTLRLYHADRLTGPWVEHPQSPIVQGDPRTARPAGRVLTAGERIVRFAQDCHLHYGTGVRAFEVTELTTTAYREREASPGPLLGPSGVGWNAGGMHHVDAQPLGDGRWIASVDGRSNIA